MTLSTETHFQAHPDFPIVGKGEVGGTLVEWREWRINFRRPLAWPDITRSLRHSFPHIKFPQHGRACLATIYSKNSDSKVKLGLAEPWQPWFNIAPEQSTKGHGIWVCELRKFAGVHDANIFPDEFPFELVLNRLHDLLGPIRVHNEWKGPHG